MGWHDLRKTFVTIPYDRTAELKAVGHPRLALTEAHSIAHVDQVVGASAPPAMKTVYWFGRETGGS